MEALTLKNGLTVKLGRIRPKAPPVALRLSNYLPKGIAAAANLPDSVDYSVKAKESISRMYLNDRLGDCVVASKAHSVGVWSGNESGTPVVATDSEIQNIYTTICGPWDQGCVITEVLNVMKSQGIVLGGQARKIDGYVAIDWTNQDEVKVALYLFGSLTLGVNLPNAWASSQDIWDVTNTSIVGGHDVAAVGYNPQGVIISTWGSLRTITWPAFTSKRWVEECYALLSPQWYEKDNVSPSGLNVQQLREDLDKLGGGTIPDINPPPAPTPPTPPTPTPAFTLDDAIAAINQGVEHGRPYNGDENLVQAVRAAAVEGVVKAWPADLVPNVFDIVN